MTTHEVEHSIEPKPRKPEERRSQIAAVFAKGILRLRTPLECLSEPNLGSPNASQENLSESHQNCLDVSAFPRPHVPAG